MVYTITISPLFVDRLPYPSFWELSSNNRDMSDIIMTNIVKKFPYKKQNYKFDLVKELIQTINALGMFQDKDNALKITMSIKKMTSRSRMISYFLINGLMKFLISCFRVKSNLRKI